MDQWPGPGAQAPSQPVAPPQSPAPAAARPPRRGRIKRWLLLAVLLAALAGGGFALARRAAPATPVARTHTVAPRPATAAQVQATLDRAALALRLRDRTAYQAALPAAGRAARRARDQLFARLAPLPWRTFVLCARAIPGAAGRFDVYAAGGLGRVAPGDRIGGERVLDFRRAGQRVVLAGDATPPALRRRYLMAFQDPVVVQRRGGLVVADRMWRPLAQKLGDDFGEARRLIAVTGIRPGAPVAVYLYSTAGEVRSALDDHSPEAQLLFFSAPTERLTPGPWTTRDVGVLAPALAGQDSWRPHMLAHELTHAYTMGWFRHTAHQPPLLVEGLATMVEADRSYQPLRRDLAARHPQLPLLTAIAEGSLWMGASTQRVHLGYLEGGSLVGYVLRRWGEPRLRRWCVAVADSDLREAGLDAATRATLGVHWAVLTSGWRRYTATLP